MKTPHDTFDELYRALNSEQREAVDTTEGPVMVLAGPGTGKTQILTLRIANIMRRSDVPASAILALTFTNAAAANMRRRLVSIVGSEGYNVSIFTFHSFANTLIEKYPNFFGAIAGFRNVSEVEQLDIIRGLLEGGSYPVLAPLGDKFRNAYDVRKAIGDLKKEGYTPTLFAEWVMMERSALEARDDLYHTKGAHNGKLKSEHERTFRTIEKNEELVRLFEGYQKELEVRKRFDFDDALLALITTLETNESFLRELQEEYQYFLVDEHQDTNGAQNKILELLATYFDEPNLFVVGDEKQAIFRFQGASLENFLYFEKKFKNVKRIYLSQNYRSTQHILDSAHSLIGHAKDTIPQELVAVRGGGAKEAGPIHTYSFAAEDEELLFLADAVQKKIREGTPAHEIAVLFRTNRDAGPIAEYFERLGVPFVIESGHGVLDDPDIRKLNLLLRAVHDLTDNDTLARVLFIDFLNIRVEDAYQAITAARRRKRSIVTVLGEKGIAFHDKKAVFTLREQLLRWSSTAANGTFPRFFEDVVRESGLLEHIGKSPFHIEKFDKLVRLFDEIKSLTARQPFFGLDDYLTFLTILEEHRLMLEAKSRQVPNAVRLMTTHKAKGLEFDYVFITGAYDTHWGNRRSVTGFVLPQGSSGSTVGTDNEDERRLFYVALTRARKCAYISHASKSADGRERVPCQFIEEIRHELREMHTGDDVGVTGKRPPLFVERKERRGVERYEEFVRKQFDERGISATALNNYLSCPWRWFYRNFFYMQFVPSIHQMRGTAVHAALQDFFNKRNSEAMIGEAYVLERLAYHLEKQELTPQEYETLLHDESEALKGYVATYQNTWTKKTVNELFIRGVQLDDSNNPSTSIKLTGMLDKLELEDEQAQHGGEVTVVDYKTGKPKSRNHMEGKTKALGAGDYYRQLVFYKLLLDGFQDGRYRMKEGVIDFVEPNERGNYKREAFTIEKEETEHIKDDIRRVAEEIRSLSFWDTRCDDPKCEECVLRDMMEG